MILEKLQKLGLAASYDSCGGGKEKSYREYGIPYEYQNFIYNCTQSSENTFTRKVMESANYGKNNSTNSSKKLYEKEVVPEETKKELWNKMSKVLPTSERKELNKPNKCLLMKVLQDNTCVHDCKYCVNTTCKQKVSLEPKELANSFEYLWKKGYTTGLFLSSAVHKSPELSTEKMIASGKLLRERGYKGYIHMKVLPETPDYLIKEMALYANRLSINIESTTAQGFEEITTTKNYKEGVLKKIGTLDLIKRKVDKEQSKNEGWFCDSEDIQNGTDMRFKSFTTQIIVGANDENDKNILDRMDSLYEETQLYRTYFSAFSPVEGTGLCKRKAEDKTREHRLYETDWLLRVYGFTKKTIESGLNEQGNLPRTQDVKESIAIANKQIFPLDLNSATREELLLVPGFGPKTVEKVLQVREEKRIKEFSDLVEIGVRINKSKNYLNIEGKQSKLTWY
jgi:predicted DNA-binding helix-hairpin-helix protein